MGRLTVYHGTDSNFEKFDTEKIGTGRGISLGGWGIYFSESQEIVEQYKTPNGRILRCEISSEPYFDLDAPLAQSIALTISHKIATKIDDNDLEQFNQDFVEGYDDATNKQVYEWLSYVLGSEKEASLFLLNKVNYVGNTYKDKTNPEISNYVVFDTYYIYRSEEVGEDDFNEEENY